MVGLGGVGEILVLYLPNTHPWLLCKTASEMKKASKIMSLLVLDSNTYLPITHSTPWTSTSCTAPYQQLGEYILF